MVALQIRNVPEDVRDTLAEQARRRGQSLQEFLLTMVEEQASHAHNATLLARFAGRSDGARLRAGEAAAELAAQRGERDSTLGTAQ